MHGLFSCYIPLHFARVLPENLWIYYRHAGLRRGARSGRRGCASAPAETLRARVVMWGNTYANTPAITGLGVIAGPGAASGKGLGVIAGPGATSASGFGDIAEPCVTGLGAIAGPGAATAGLLGAIAAGPGPGPTAEGAIALQAESEN